MLARLRLLTAGESHGKALMGILEGMPAGVPLDRALLQHDMDRRRGAAGRSARMTTEGDVVEVLGGVRHGRTLGSPIGFTIENRDHAKWRDTMSPWPIDGGDVDARAVAVPRPGHADLAGAIKLGLDDARDVLERASARETAARTAAGAFCRQLLGAVGIDVGSHVVSLGEIDVDAARVALQLGAADVSARADASPLRVLDDAAASRMQQAIAAARAAGDTLGGVVEVVADGLPIGLGHYAHWDRRLSARLMEALGSIHAVRSVAFGSAPSTSTGRAFHDSIVDVRGARGSNRAGGVEGGMTNGMPLVVRAYVKPLSTVAGGLDSVRFESGEPARGHVERSDTTAVPAASIVAEAMVCLVLADALLEKFGGDSLEQLRAHMAQSARRIQDEPQDEAT